MNICKVVLALTFVIISGCSDSVDKAKDEHVFKTQTDALDKAKQAEQMIMDAANQQKIKIDEQSR